MPEQGADILAHFGEDHFLERYQRYKAHIAEWRQQYPQLAAVDLRYDQQVVLEMASGKRPQPEPSAGAMQQPAAGRCQPTAPAPTSRSLTCRSTHAKPASEATPATALAARKKAALEKKRAEARRAALDSRRRKAAGKTSATAPRSTRPAAPRGAGTGNSDGAEDRTT